MSDVGIDDVDRVALPIDPIDALRALLRVDPEAEPVESENEESPEDE